MTDLPFDPADLSAAEFSDAFDEVIDLYEPGVLPGCSPIEITQASRFGFTQHQAEQTVADERLLDIVRRSWDNYPVPDVVRDQASGSDQLALAVAELLHRTGHTLDIERSIEGIDWILLADSVLSAGAVKGQRASDDAQSWTVDDPFVDAAVLVQREGEGYRVRCVPEITRGPALLVLRWRGGGDTRVLVTVIEGEVVDEWVESPAGLTPDAIAFVSR